MRAADLLLAGVTGGRVAVVAAIAGWFFQVLPEGHVRRDAEPSRRSRTIRLRDHPGDRRGLADRLDPHLAREHDPRLLGFHRRAAGRSADHRLEGLLQTRRSVVPIARIQAIRLEENLVRRAFGLASLRVLTAGYGQRFRRRATVEHARPGRRSSAMPRALARRSSGPDGISGTAGILPAPATSPRASPVPRSGRRYRRHRARAGAAPGRCVRGGASRSPARARVRVPGLARLSAMPSSDRTSWRAREPCVRRTTVANQANIQHLVLRRSPTQRPFGLASLTLAIPKAADIRDRRRS